MNKKTILWISILAFVAQLLSTGLVILANNWLEAIIGALTAILALLLIIYCNKLLNEEEEIEHTYY